MKNISATNCRTPKCEISFVVEDSLANDLYGLLVGGFNDVVMTDNETGEILCSHYVSPTIANPNPYHTMLQVIGFLDLHDGLNHYVEG
jgi:hypothetical protein